MPVVAVIAPSVSSQRYVNISQAVLALTSAVALLYFGRVFFITLAIAIIIAFLLEPVVLLFMRMRLPRGMASFVVCTIALLGMYLAGLAMYSQISSLAEELPTYSERINLLTDTAASRVDEFEKKTIETLMPKRFQEKQQEQIVATARNKKKGPLPPPTIQEVRIKAEPTPLLSYVYAYVSSFYNVLLMASFVPFLVYFMLSWRDHLRRSFLYLFEGQHRHIAGKSWESVAEMARAYVLGNFFLGLLLGTASAVFFFFMGLPYWPLVGAVSGFLSLVPYVGLPLAMAPPLVSAVAVTTNPTAYVLIGGVVGVFHLLALNLLYPKLVGSRVHLNPLAVTIALMFWGTLWGGIGLLLAIPITAGIKAVFDNIGSLQPYGKLLGD